ncbi:hypothetical protein BH24ACT26_BH24ACT26_09330 [soil metagenome]
MEAALKVNEIASSQQPLHDAVQDMVDIAVDLLGAEQGSIMLLEDGGRTLVLVASSGALDVPVGHRLAIGESIAGRVIATERPMLLGEIEADHFVNFVPKSRAISSSLVVPLRIRGGAIGVLSLAKSDGSAAFTDEDLRVAQLFADQAGGLLHRARLHDRAERRSADLLALVASSEGLLGALDLEELLQRVLDGGARLTGSREGFACLFDPETGSVARGVFRGFDKAKISELVSDPAVRRAVSTSSVAKLDGGLVAVGWRTTRGTGGLLILDVPGDLEHDRADLLRAFAQQCATAVGAAELHTEVDAKESELSSIILGVPNPIVVVDAHGRISDLNPAAEQLFGVSAPFSHGLAVSGSLGHEEIEGLLMREGELESEVVMGAPARTYRVRVADVRAPGSAVGRLLIMDDLTAERAIAQTQRDFVAMIGHELRTPLTIIKGFARTALRTVATASPEHQEEALTTIDSKAAQLERLIEDLLYVSKVESREASLRVEDIDVPTLVETVVEEVVQQHPGRDVVLELPRALGWPCDETKVGLIVRHLVANALKYSEAPHPVIVRALHQDDELRVEVVDHGVGLLSGDIPRIFERFRQLDSSSTREHGGTGVGLYLCAQLIRIHGGRIWVDSTWGQGSTFSFSLPKRPSTPKVVRMATPSARHQAAGSA